jgi:DNA polymerase-4
MIIFHLDMDSFFASVEQQARPWLRGKPIVVSGRPDIHSVVAAASKEAKCYGIRSGMTTWEARELCPHVIFVPGDPEKYEMITRRFLGILLSYTPMIEVYSIDEVFLDATDIAGRYGGPLALALRMKSRLRKALGSWITCTIGIGPNKLLAKLATERAKPDGIGWIRPEDVPTVLEETPVEEVCGIGPKIARRLSHMGIWTLADLGRYPMDYLRKAFGVYGEILSLWGRGLDPTPLRPFWEEEEEKSIGHSHAVPRELRHPEGACKVLLYLCVKTARRLRARGFAGRVIHAFFRDAGMRYYGAQRALSTPTFDEERIYHTAMEIIDRLGGFPEETTLVGVRVAGLEHLQATPRPLFPEDARRERLLHALDRIRDRFGEEAVILATVLECRLTTATGGMGREREIARMLRGRSTMINQWL